MMHTEIKPYKHYGECLFLRNDAVELACALQFGIRVVRFCMLGGENVFYEQPANAAYLCSEAGWRVHAGHRLVLAPESELTYWPDTQPVEYALLPDGVLLTQSEDGYLHIQKQLQLTFTDDPYTVEARYIATNLADAPLDGALWSISAMAAGCVLTVPFGPVMRGAAPSRFLSLWGDTCLGDERLAFYADKAVFSQTDSAQYFKLGLWCNEGTARCLSQGQRFTKRFSALEGAQYPDNGCNLEVYICAHMMEFETLAPLTRLMPGEPVSHSELWRLEKA